MRIRLLNQFQANFKLGLIILFALIFSKFEGIAQCVNLVSNPILTGTFEYVSPKNEFANGKVPSWVNVLGTSDIVSNAVSSPSCGRIYSYYYSGNYHEGFGQSVTLTTGKTYLVSFMAKRDAGLSTSGVGGNIRLHLRNYSNGFNTIPTGGWSSGNINDALAGSTTICSYQLSNSWTNYSFCFTAQNSTDFLFFTALLSSTTSGEILWMEIDDVEIYEVTADAGPDKTITCDSQCVWLGTHCLPGLHVTRSFKWYENGSQTPFDTNSLTRVCPKVNTQYILEVEMDSCIAFDTVNVFIGDTIAPIVDLGNDTVICGSVSLTIVAGTQTGNTYLWNTGAITNEITITTGGTYSVVVKDSSGCSGTDTINIITRPEYNLFPKDTIVCKYSFPIRLRIYPKSYDSVRWFNQSTNLQTRVFGPGDYWVIVWDSFCFDTGWIHVDTFGPPFLFIGGDRTLCEGASDTICDSNVVLYNKGIIKYRWSNENQDTTPCIVVNKSGIYRLIGYNQDTACADTTQINVTVLTAPPINCPSFQLCKEDPPIVINGCNPAPGDYYHSLLDTNDVFDPLVFGVGTHLIKYTYMYNNPNPTCFTYGNVEVIVHPSPEVRGDTTISVCVTDPEFEMPLDGDSGTFYYYIDNNQSSNMFDPASVGPGIHTCKLKIVNQWGCKDSAEITIIVMDTFDVWITQNPNNLSCFTEPVTLTANVSDTGRFNYTWNTGSDKKKIKVSQTGDYCVIVYDSLLACRDSAFYHVDFVDCCDSNQVPGTIIDDSFHTGNNVIWDNQTIFLDHDLLITSGATLNIRNSTVYVRYCSKITVDANFWQGAPGYLEIENSKIGMCPWKGIDVRGNYDACSDNANAHGKLKMYNHSVLTNADVGIFVGKRDGTTHDRTFSGGIIDLVDDTFRNNYVDIMFSEWSFAGICACAYQSGTEWQSTINNCYFDTLAPSYFCDDYVDVTLDYYYNFYLTPPPQCPVPLFNPPIDPQVPVRCHIIDLSPYVEIWLSQIPSLCPYLVCRKSYWESGQFGNILNYNTFKGDGSTPPCYSVPPHNNYR